MTRRESLLAGAALLLESSAAADAPPTGIAVEKSASRLRITTRRIVVTLDLSTGLWDARWNNEIASLTGVDTIARLADGRVLAARASVSHVADEPIAVSDSFGRGLEFGVRHNSVSGAALRTRFTLYPETPFFFVQSYVLADSPVGVEQIDPLVIDDVQTLGAHVKIDTKSRPRTLFVPYDNDLFVRYNSEFATASFGVTAIYVDDSRRGMVVGAVTHDLWKVGLSMERHSPGALGRLAVTAGVTGYWTHDKEPHGVVTGKDVASCRIFVGAFVDWRDGLETYGRAVSRHTPPLPWSGGVPVGWNSWSAYKETITAPEYAAASTFLFEHLKPLEFVSEGGAVFVNADAFWDFIPEKDFLEVVRQIRRRGQTPGIYWTPFTYWGDDFARKVDGTDGSFTYADILLKGSDGQPLPKLDNGWAIDITHPAALARIDWQMKRFVDWGFGFVKLDFLTHGALEGRRHDPTVPTGTAAYHLGMKRVLHALDPKKIGRPFFVSLSIAPLFPSGYGHARRISCDAFGSIGHTEYVLNALTYGWWQHKTLYRFNDPDHAVLFREHGQSPTSGMEGRSRYNSAVIAGTMLLNGDDLTDEAARSRVEKLVANRDVLAIAKADRPFRPVRGDTGGGASDVFVRDDGAGGVFVAVFNYKGGEAAMKRLDLARLGLKSSTSYRWRDLWRGTSGAAMGVLPVELAPAESTILQILAPSSVSPAR